jgi:uncharacterized membrane protein (UPF0127 family)
MLREIKTTLNGQPFLDRAELATSMTDRMRGLLGRDSLPPNHGLLILPCPSIHMFGMRFAIDAIFLDRDGRVVRVVRNIAPWAPFVSGGFGSHSTLEIATGWLQENAIKTGDRIAWQIQNP